VNALHSRTLARKEVPHASGSVPQREPAIPIAAAIAPPVCLPAQTLYQGEHSHGTAKSHLAHALAHEAARQGASVLCTSAHQMLVHINAGRADGTYAKRMATYLRPTLLVIDDFGLKPLPASGPVDFYDVINERYEQRSIVLTSNRAPTELPALFGDPLLANATLDRLAHSAVVLTITGRSFRLNGRANQNPKEAPPSPEP